MTPEEWQTDWREYARRMRSQVATLLADAEKMESALVEIGAGNLDGESYEEFHDRARVVAKSALGLWEERK
jgi:hypothetical protein